MWQTYVHAIGIAVLICHVASPPASAEDAGAHFKDKTITIFVAGTSGGGIHIGARLLAPFLGKYLPGTPRVIVQEMPGAGGRRALQHLATLAKRDGSEIAAFSAGSFLDPIIEPKRSSYRIAGFTPVGALDPDNSLCTTWHTSQVKTLAQARKRVVTMAGVGAGSDSDMLPVVLNKVLGTKFRLITGYLGTVQSALAMERGEVEGRCGPGFESIKRQHPDWTRLKRINLIVQFGVAPHLIPTVPSALDLVDAPEDKAILKLISSHKILGTAYLAPPDLVPKLAADLRRAFMSATSDPEFRVIYSNRSSGDQPQPMEGAVVQRHLTEMQATPPYVVERLRKLLNSAKVK